jgi:hypothetical protein
VVAEAEAQELPLSRISRSTLLSVTRRAIAAISLSGFRTFTSKLSNMLGTKKREPKKSAPLVSDALL